MPTLISSSRMILRLILLLCSILCLAVNSYEDAIHKDTCVEAANKNNDDATTITTDTQTTNTAKDSGKELVHVQPTKFDETALHKFLLNDEKQKSRWNFWKDWFSTSTLPTSEILHNNHWAQHRKARLSSRNADNGMVLEVYDSSKHHHSRHSYWNFYTRRKHNYENDNKDSDDATTTTKTHSSTTEVDVSYELLEPVELELGRVQVHVVDYAYSPVLRSRAIQVAHPEQQQPPFSMQESTHGGGWWQWWLPWSMVRDFSKHRNDPRHSQYRFQEAFAGGSHGEVWRGRRKCTFGDCNEALIFKRLKVETGYQALEAGLREVYFGNLLHDLDTGTKRLFTEYVEHFFGESGELWIVFKDAGASLSSYLYTGNDAGDYMIYEHSFLWTLIRMSLAKQNLESDYEPGMVLSESHRAEQLESKALVGRQLVGSFLKQIIEAAAVLHQNGIVHRDIKPSNVMCKTNLNLEHLRSLDVISPKVDCVLGDFSSAYNSYTGQHLYTRGPSRREQTDEYSPPEAIFGHAYNDTVKWLGPSFDSWSIGIVILELLLGTPNVFSVDQRTRMVLTHKLEKKGATAEEIEKAMYLAALSQFCIYNPSQERPNWPLRDGDPLHKSAMTKHTCTLHDFHRALRARDPLGWGFEANDSLLHLIWQLLAWDPEERISATEALSHPYFASLEIPLDLDAPLHWNALESQMLDPRMDFNISDSIDEFRCRKCGRRYSDWHSCHKHVHSRKHGKFCAYDRNSLPTCLNAHSMLPAHSYSGYCDIQGRRRTIEDFHAIHLLPDQQFYGIFDGHLGNFASKYASSFLYSELSSRLSQVITFPLAEDWKDKVEEAAGEAFAAIHEKFLQIIVATTYRHGFMDYSGTTATALLASNDTFVIASLGDSRAVLSAQKVALDGQLTMVPIQLTKDHVASDPDERSMVESKGGIIVRNNGVDRVNGSLAITRSIGDGSLAPFLSRIPHVISMTKNEILELCGEAVSADSLPCFLILASDGLWDTVDNQEAVDLVAEVVMKASGNDLNWRETAGLQRAAEALTLEAYVRGSSDNIGVCIIAIE